MNRLSLWLAWRYLCFSKKDKNVSFMIRICFLGILIGTFALMLTLIITNGFEKVIHEKMQGITSQVIMYAPGQQIDGEGIKKLLATPVQNPSRPDSTIPASGKTFVIRTRLVQTAEAVEVNVGVNISGVQLRDGYSLDLIHD